MVNEGPEYTTTPGPNLIFETILVADLKKQNQVLRILEVQMVGRLSDRRFYGIEAICAFYWFTISH